MIIVEKALAASTRDGAVGRLRGDGATASGTMWGMFAARTGWDRTPNRLAAAAGRRTADLIDLTVSNPTQWGLAYDREAILRALARPEALTYGPEARGLPVARAAVAAYYAERGVEVNIADLLLTASSSEAYAYLFRLLCAPGDTVLVPTPSYPLFELLAGLNDVRLRPYPLFYDHGWHLDAVALEAAIQPHTRAIVCVHPNNPSGSYLKQEEWEQVQALAAAHELAVIVDEVFFDYALAADPERMVNPCNQPPALTFVLNGLSKLAALPQMKLGWMAIAGPPPLVEEAGQRLEIIADTYLSVCTAIQWAAPTLLATRRTMQPQLLSRLKANLQALDEQIASHSGGVTRLVVEGGWSVVLRVPRWRSDDAWAEHLVAAAGVLVHPGHFYDFPDEGHLVLSLLPQPERFQHGVAQMLRAVG